MASTLHPPCGGGLALSAPLRPPKPDKPEWWRSAACRGSDPAIFHSTPVAHRQAQAVCRRCPVADICLWSAMVDEAPTPYRYGVWGGLTPPQRHALAAELAEQFAADGLDERLVPGRRLEAGHRPVGEYRRRLQGALSAWQAAQAAHTAQGATDAA